MECTTAEGGSHRGNKTESCRPMAALLTWSRLLMQTRVDFSLKCQRHEGKTFPWPPWIWINELFRRWVFSPRRPGGSLIILSCEVHQRPFSWSDAELGTGARGGAPASELVAPWTSGHPRGRLPVSWACVLVFPVLGVPGLPEPASLITSLWSLFLTPDCHLSINIHAEFHLTFTSTPQQLTAAGRLNPQVHLRGPRLDPRPWAEQTQNQFHPRGKKLGNCCPM